MKQPAAATAVSWMNLRRGIVLTLYLLPLIP
jgi:hypothetical protein